jgi:hypothetical protein
MTPQQPRVASSVAGPSAESKANHGQGHESGSRKAGGYESTEFLHEHGHEHERMLCARLTNGMSSPGG